MGPMTFGKREEQIFLGREISKTQDYSEETALRIDKEIKRFVMDNYDRAREVLTEHKDALLKIADELLAREVLDADQVTRLAKGLALEEPLPRRRRRRPQPATRRSANSRNVRAWCRRSRIQCTGQGQRARTLRPSSFRVPFDLCPLPFALSPPPLHVLSP